MLIRSRILLPITAPLVEDGAVAVSGDRIVAVGRWKDLRDLCPGPVVDLGEVAVLPGFINAHCHLDYTHLAGHLPPPRHFSDWIQGVLALKAGWSFSEYAASWIAGAQQLLRSGCTTVLDIEAVPELLPEAWGSTALRVVSALEMTGVRSAAPVAEILESALARAASLRHSFHRVALSPHAPYSTRRELLERTAVAARELGLLVTIHVAESDEEFEMFRHARGTMHQWLSPQRGGADCGQCSPVRHVVGAGLAGPGVIFAHVNYLDDGDAQLLGSSGTQVVHCPRSHSYFSHSPFPLNELRAAGVNVCLGTDSVLSVRRLGRLRPELDFFAELQEFTRVHPGVPARTVLRLATTEGARALGRAGELGELKPGAAADLIAVPTGAVASGHEEAVIAHRGPVTASMIAGAWAMAPEDATVPLGRPGPDVA